MESYVDELAARAKALLAPGGGGPRRIVGIAGPPGAGKSTLAEAVVRELDGLAALVPMDGFHLADVELARLGRADRKGAPDTFDAYGYGALLARLRAPRDGETVYAPSFEREWEQPLAGALPVAPEVPLIVTEGNYLLLDEEPWPAVVRPHLDEVWWVAVDEDVRVERLIARHVEFGKSPAAAREWVLRSDEANARRVASGRARADVVVESDAERLVVTPGRASRA
ncbi:nucleoside/nucleotide kinase family protein [Streptomyces sp. VRA16 Mangrove soil]|uniref:nucleoside/nucleotide kinase family protein n=1 Tax=Streptomyces sp. VRA16 Mangrove soil TaxID=2817434 RepID=UPI001A9EDAA7|nr:nucleoside/nucleotide kinase family protein [Streptomyces sp. VRA16 Mangrove soil]MBO1337833.1 nucleoside/nucleotide kinase family protein [Streptomyces sp. VRA16 Mangrove soil]